MPHVQTTGFQPLTATLPGGSQRNDRAVQRSLRDSVADALGVNAKGHGVHGLAVALREKLAASETGADAVPSILETINRALDDAAAKLAAQGVSQEQIDAGVARFRNKLAREIGEFVRGEAADKPVENTAIASSMAVRKEVRERFSLDIVTAEGDKVSIRFKSLSVTEVAAAQVTRDGVTSTAGEANLISRGRFQVEVDGNLNDAERTAIADLLDKVDGIATDFFDGDVQAAFAAAVRVGLDSSALSAFDLKLSYSKSTSVAAAYAKTAALTEPVTLPAETQAPVAAPVTTPAVPESSPVAAPDAAPASEGTATTPALATATAKAVSARETISSFAKQVLERLDKDDESDAAKFSLRWKVEFLLKAFGSVALTPVEQAAADALGIALDAEQAL